MKVFYIEDFPPRVQFGAGLPRSRAVVEALLAQGAEVFIYPVFGLRAGSLAEAEAQLPRGARLVESSGPQGIAYHLSRHAAAYDLLWVCRKPHMMQVAKLADFMPALRLPPIVYDTEALDFIREVRRHALAGQAPDQAALAQASGLEARLAGRAKAVIAVSEEDRAFFARQTKTPAILVAASVTTTTRNMPLATRKDMLFVGAFNHESEPNADAVNWFASHILPRVHAATGARLRLAGWGSDRLTLAPNVPRDAFEVLGPLDDLSACYASARVFVAPTRFAAGIPLKVIEAAAQGLPVVATPLLAAQLGWEPGVDLLTGPNAERFAEACVNLLNDDALWERVAQAGQQRVARQFSPEVFAAGVRAAVTTATEAHRPERDEARLPEGSS